MPRGGAGLRPRRAPRPRPQLRLPPRCREARRAGLYARGAAAAARIVAVVRAPIWRRGLGDRDGEEGRGSGMPPAARRGFGRELNLKNNRAVPWYSPALHRGVQYGTVYCTALSQARRGETGLDRGDREASSGGGAGGRIAAACHNGRARVPVRRGAGASRLLHGTVQYFVGGRPAGSAIHAPRARPRSRARNLRGAEVATRQLAKYCARERRPAGGDSAARPPVARGNVRRRARRRPGRGAAEARTGAETPARATTRRGGGTAAVIPRGPLFGRQLARTIGGGNAPVGGCFSQAVPDSAALRAEALG
jgi:hypothetical protein